MDVPSYHLDFEGPTFKLFFNLAEMKENIKLVLKILFHFKLMTLLCKIDILKDDELIVCIKPLFYIIVI